MEKQPRVEQLWKVFILKLVNHTHTYTAQHIRKTEIYYLYTQNNMTNIVHADK